MTYIFRKEHCMIRKLAIAVSLILAVALMSGCGGGDFIAKGGKSAYRIVIPETASPATINGANELQAFLNEMTGAEIPIVSDSLPLTENEIILGDNKHLKEIGVEIDFEPLGDEGYILRTVGKYIVIAGGAQRGNMYGVYGLLEDHFDCRWFTPELSRIPKVTKLALPQLDETIIPALEYREPHIFSNRNADWAVRNRINSYRSKGTENRYGGTVDWVPGYFVHTFERLVPKKEFYKKHPEYFSLVSGKRIPELSQLCCTNKDVQEIVVERVKKVLRENPDARLISVSQNDCYNYCECPKCQALAKEEGSQMAPVLALVNLVADEIKDEFPDVAVMTLAYQWTRHACKAMKPRDNVIIRLCSIECCFTHPFDVCDGPINAGFYQDLVDWSKMSDRLYIWNYTTNFSNFLLPHPNLLHRQHNLKLFVDHHVTGVFQQDTPSIENGELSQLGAYVHAKLLWNPDYDQEKAISEFLEAFYGPAASQIREYIDYIHDKAKTENVHMGCYESPESDLFTGTFFETVFDIFDRAEAAAAGQPEYLERVKAARLSPEYAWVARDINNKAFVIDQENMNAHFNEEYMARLDKFTEDALKYGVNHLDETGMSHEAFRSRIEGVLPKEALKIQPAMSVKNPKPGIAWKSFLDWQDQPEFKKAKVYKQGVMERIELPEHGPTDLFGTLHEGYIDIPADGVYGFYTGSDDGSVLWIDGKLAVDNGGRHWMQERIGFVALEKGMHKIKTGWFNGAGGLGLNASWKGPGFDKQIIPANVLYH